MKRSICPRPRHTVLVVDDDRWIRKVLRRLVENEGFECLESGDGLEALALAVESRPCVALLDLNMPGLDGISLCRRLKEDPATTLIPIGLISGNLDTANLEAGLNAGASDFIRKPVDLEELRCRIHVLLRLHELTLSQQRNREQLLGISQAAKDAIIMLDGDGNISFWNQAAKEMFGYDLGEAIGRNLHELLAPARDVDLFRRGFSEFQQSGTGRAVGKVLDLVAVRKSGEEFPIEISVAAKKLDGRWSAVGIVRDVTERRALEEASRQNEARMQLILDGVPVGIAMVSRDRRIRWANRTILEMAQNDDFLEEIAGLPCGAIIGKPGSHPCPLDDPTYAVSGVERQLPRSDGTFLSVLHSAHEVEFGDEKVLLETFVDLTERKQLEVKLAHARKLEAVGQLAAGIAHEINTPIQFIGDSVVFLKEAFESFWKLIPAYRQAVEERRRGRGDDAAGRRVAECEEEVDLDYLLENVPGALDRCDDGVRRVAKIVRAMKEFAHPDATELKPADLNHAISNTLVIARNEYKYVADIETELGDIPPVPCYLGDLNQVFLNLIVNAAHAIGDATAPDGGRGKITVRTRTEGEAVVIEFSDTGTGIPEAVRDRVFDPFFTTKPVGQGSGQGLAIARSVVEKHRGTITFETEAGKGTTFRIHLPLGGVLMSASGGRS